MSSKRFLPYGRQSIDDGDVAAVVAVLRGDFLTQGPEVEAFERDLAEVVGARHAVAMSHGTAALFAACHAAGVGPGHEVITSPLTFVASANAAHYVGARAVLADVEPVAGTLDPAAFERAITPRTRAVVPVCYAGQPPAMAEIHAIARRHGIAVIEDAAHALGAAYEGRPVGSCAFADMTMFSFHPVKHVTTGEGGAVTTNDPALAARLRLFRNHGLTRDPAAFSRPPPGPWYMEQVELGHNFRLTDLQAALGRSQLRKLARFVERRRALARRYDRLLSALDAAPSARAREALAGGGAAEAGVRGVRPLGRLAGEHAFHLYVVRIDFAGLGTTRARVMDALRERNVGTQVHYVPVHLHPYHAKAGGFAPGSLPVAEALYEEILSLPLFPAMTDDDVDCVVGTLREVLRG